MIFKRSIQRYGRTPLPETPYQRAGQLWDERIGSARVQARNWRYMALSAYDFVTQRGAQFLGDYARSAAPFDQIGERTVSVQVTSVVRASDQSFQVKWLETAFERGAKADTTRWTAILGVTTRTPQSADALRRNPLGIYIDAIDWSRELEPPEPASPAIAEPANPSVDAQAPADPSRSPASPSSQEDFQ